MWLAVESLTKNYYLLSGQCVSVIILKYNGKLKLSLVCLLFFTRNIWMSQLKMLTLFLNLNIFTNEKFTKKKTSIPCQNIIKLNT